MKNLGWMVRSKYTRALSCYISIRMLRELKRVAEEGSNRPALHPALEVEFSGHMYYPPERWVMIPIEEFQRLTKNKGVK